MAAPQSDTLLEFFFMRHAKTIANENRVADGGDSVETDLADSAADELEITRTFLSQMEGIISTIYYTEMSRSFKTASGLNQTLDKPLALSRAFNEQRLGDWEGISWDEAAKQHKLGHNPPNGEENQAFLRRIETGLKGLSEIETNDGKIPLIVSHGGVWLGINKLCGIDSDDWPENCDIFKARITGDWDNPNLEFEQVFGLDT